MLFYEEIHLKIPHLPFYFIRHGETDWNRSNRIMGQTDIPLNRNGIIQAHESKELLRKVAFGRIWSSPLQRARQTAETIKGNSSYLVGYNEYLKERGWGKGEGDFHENLLDFKLSETNLPEGAEPYKVFEGRVIKAFNEILKESAEQPPLVVGHGGIFWILTKLLANSSIPAENCALYFFRPPEHPSHPWFIVNLKDG